MKIITNDAGRVNHRFNPDEVRPIGGYNVPEITRLISERYNFGYVPSIEEVRTRGAVFREGRLIAGSTKINISEIEIYSNGISATAQDTNSAEFIVDDIIAWSQQAIGLRPQQIKQPRLYENALVVEFDQRLEKSFSMFDEISRSFEKMMANLYNENIPTLPYRFGISGDPMVNPPVVGMRFGFQFQIERRIGVPYSSNRFYSLAPLQTKMHVELLEEFERALG